jgi:hypothetical protein
MAKKRTGRCAQCTAPIFDDGGIKQADGDLLCALCDEKRRAPKSTVTCAHCGLTVQAGLIRCGSCGTATPAMASHKTKYERAAGDKVIPVDQGRTRNTTSLKQGDRKLPPGMLHGYNMDSGDQGKE